MEPKTDPSDIQSIMTEMSDSERENEPRRESTEYASLLQSKIREIWVKMLGISSFSLSDDLFDVGGDSITAIQIFSEINKEFGIRLPMEKLFAAESFSIEWLSSLVAHHLVELLGDDEFDSLLKEVDSASLGDVQRQLSEG